MNNTHPRAARARSDDGAMIRCSTNRFCAKPARGSPAAPAILRRTPSCRPRFSATRRVGRGGIVSGLEPFARTFTLVDERVSVLFHAADGDRVEAGTRSRASADRCAPSLPPNARRSTFSATSPVWRRQRIASCKPWRVHRPPSSTPQDHARMRALKGGRPARRRHNHRFGLDDAILIKTTTSRLPAASVRPLKPRAPTPDTS